MIVYLNNINMNEQELAQFVEWLPSSVSEFKDKTPKEIVIILNKMSQTEEGMNMISDLINQFKQNSMGMFKSGGKLNYLIIKFKEGGETPRKSDKGRKEFHGVNLFEYGPNKYRSSRGDVYRSLKDGINQTVLPNGIGLRQITRNNITTSELVSPDKRDTLYIHNGVGGRVDSNIDDSGILGVFGLIKSSPVSNRYRELQGKFNTQKFEDGGETENSKSTTKKASNGKTYTVDAPDTLQGYVVRRISRKVGDDAYNVTNQVYKIGEPNNAKYFWTPYAVTGSYLETLRKNPLDGNSNPIRWNKRKDLTPLYDELYK